MAFIVPFVVIASAVTAAPVEDRLLWHPVRLDAQGKLLSWVEGDAPYAHVVDKAWDAFLNIPIQPNGYRTYFAYPVFYGPNDAGHKLYEGRSWCHNPGSLFAMLTDSALLYHAYSGNRTTLRRVREMLDHYLKSGMTKPTDAWSSVPYACSDAGELVYRGATDSKYEGDGIGRGRGDGRGNLEPDKIGELGSAYLSFYKVTDEPKYRLQAIRCADALAKHVTPGDQSHSPWPFRVDAKTGKLAPEPYCANVIGPIKLFDELIRLKIGNVPAYTRVRNLAWSWMFKYPMRNHVWTGYFEDILKYPDYRTNVNQYSPMETARYILQHPEKNPNWKSDAKGLIDWVTGFFAVDSHTMAGLPEKGNQWGAEVVSEQVNDMDKMSSHTARFASVLALWYEKTGDVAARERAFRSFNWATYSARENGLVKTSLDEGTGYWFSDGYGDYMRHFQRGMASVPEWAPAGENHLLGTTSVVRSIAYRPKRIQYRTFDAKATEVLRLRSKPLAVMNDGVRLKLRTDVAKPGYTVRSLDGGGVEVKIHHRHSGDVAIRL